MNEPKNCQFVMHVMDQRTKRYFSAGIAPPGAPFETKVLSMEGTAASS
jgi:hypothetical protein